MAKNSLVINCDFRETRVALIEDGVIAELQIERAAARGTVGNIVLGKVTRVLPGMQAAFIDVGMERAAFLHVEDLIRPTDFEAYLAGDAREEERAAAGGAAGKAEEVDDDAEPESTDSVAQSSRDSAVDSAELEDEDILVEEDDDHEELIDEDEEDELDNDATDEDDSDDSDDGDDDDDDDGAEEGDDTEEGAIEDEAVGDDEALTPRPARKKQPRPSKGSTEPPSGASPDHELEETWDETPDSLDDDIEEEEEEEEERERPRPGAAGGQARRRRRARGRGAEGRQKMDASRESSADAEKRSRERRGRALRRPNRNDRVRREGTNGKHDTHRTAPSRVSRSVPITEVVKEGDEVIVQISKEPIGTKGARVTSHISLPGRYTVYLPTVEHLGISKRIGSARERARLRQVIETLKPPRGGIIVRTVAESLTKKSLKADIGYLVKLWGEVSRRRETAKSPEILYAELDLVLKTARDLFTEDIEKIVIDDREQYARLIRFIEMFMPERAKDVELYQGKEPIFDAYGIEDEIGRALSRKVPLPSGGHLIIDQAEALTAIDVNTGRYVGKGSKDLEETALKTNLEAVDEIAYQLRFRNIGGLVILDLIDMDVPSNRDKVWRALEQGLAKDKAKTTLDRISDLGLIEMTRKRTRESLTRTMHETCFYCDGTGQIQSRATISFEILRQIRRERDTLTGYSVVVRAHPSVVDWMTHEEKDAVKEAERRYSRRIEFQARREYHIEQFDLQGK